MIHSCKASDNLKKERVTTWIKDIFYPALTPHLLLQIEYDIDSLVKDEQFGLWFVRAQV